jgi:hypothetical protein
MRATLEVSLIEWPNGPLAGGPRLLGRCDDPDLISAVRERLAAERRRELARLEGPVRLVTPNPGSEEPRP